MQAFAGCCFSRPTNTPQDPVSSEQEPGNSLPSGCIIEGDTLTFTGSRVTKKIGDILEKYQIKFLVTTNDVIIDKNSCVSNKNLLKVEFKNNATFGNNCFFHSENLTTIEVAGNATLGGFCFLHCKKLRTIEVGENAKFGEYACPSCVALECVKINGDATFGNDCFLHCKKLRFIAFNRAPNIFKPPFPLCDSLNVVYSPNNLDPNSIKYDKINNPLKYLVITKPTAYTFVTNKDYTPLPNENYNVPKFEEDYGFQTHKM